MKEELQLLKREQEDSIHTLAENSFLQHSIHAEYSTCSHQAKLSELNWKISHIRKTLCDSFSYTQNKVPLTYSPFPSYTRERETYEAMLTLRVDYIV